MKGEWKIFLLHAIAYVHNLLNVVVQIANKIVSLFKISFYLQSVLLRSANLYYYVHNLLNIVVQIANKMRF
jgi:hypothetical protein